MTADPQTLSLPAEAPPRELVERVAAALGAGELVVLPSETVYGLAARADVPGALERLRAAAAAHGFGEEPPTWTVPSPDSPDSPDSLDAFGRVSPVVRRLAGRYWPGPLTLVLPGAARGAEALEADGWTRVRCPAHPSLSALLRALGAPIGVLPLDGGASVTRAADAALPEAALVVDGGPCRIGEPSTLLVVGAGRFEVLRTGLVSSEDLRRTAGRRIGFVCTGNTCRSPMAAALARRLLAERLGLGPDGDPADFGFQVRSMGVFAPAGSPASPHAVTAMRERGLDLSGHASRTALPEDVAELDVVYGLTRGHVEALTSALPPGRAAHVELLDVEGGDVPDPIGGDLEAYRACAAHLERLLRARLDAWA